MEKDKIIKYIKDEIENETDTFHWFDDTPENQTRKQIEESINAHQGLLDLYNKEKRQNKIKDEYLKLICDIGFDYDGYEKSESLKELIDELVDLAKKAIKNDDKSVVYTGGDGLEFNILRERLDG